MAVLIEIKMVQKVHADIRQPKISSNRRQLGGRIIGEAGSNTMIISKSANYNRNTDKEALTPPFDDFMSSKTRKKNVI